MSRPAWLILLVLMCFCRVEAAAAKPFVNVFVEHNWTLGPVEFRVAETERLSTTGIGQVIIPGRQVVLSAGLSGRGRRGIDFPCSLSVFIGMAVAMLIIMAGVLAAGVNRRRGLTKQEG